MEKIISLFPMYYLEKSNMLIEIEEENKMSLHPKAIPPIPEDTARVARAAFPKGNIYLQLRDTSRGDKPVKTLIEREFQPLRSRGASAFGNAL